MFKTNYLLFICFISISISEKSEQLNSQHKKDRNEIENLIRENEKLKSEMHLKDDRIKKIEIKLILNKKAL